MVSKLPENWISVNFDTITLLAQNGCGARRGKEGIPTVVLRLLDLSLDGSISTEKQRLVPLSDLQISKYALERGDLLAFRVNGSKDIAGQVVYYKGPEKYVFCDHFIRLKLHQQVANPRYISFAFKAPDVRSQIETRMVSSAGQNTVAQSTYAGVNLPLPPLNEQRRIVAKIEALTTHSRKAREALDAIPALLDQFRQSVLAAAFRGDLTADWRVQNPDVEPAEKLLERVCGKRIVQYEEECAVARSLNLKKPKKPSYFSFDLDQEVEYSQELPKNWVIAPVGLLCDCIVPGRDKPKSFTGEIPWITIPDLVLDEIYKSQQGVGLTKQEISEVKARIIPVGSVIMSCVGRFGISSIARQPIVVNQQLHAFLKSDLLEPRYLMYQIRSLASYMDGLATSTTVAYLNKSNCNNLPINLPPVEEQKLIVSRLDKAWDVISTLESRYLGFAEKVWSTAQKSHRLPPGCWPSYGGQG